jgi:hypothetical protein
VQRRGGEAALRELAKDGVATTVDLLGEETLSDVEADAYLERYVALIRRLPPRPVRLSSARQRAVPPVNISIAGAVPGPELMAPSGERNEVAAWPPSGRRNAAFVNLDMSSTGIRTSHGFGRC